MQFYQPTAQLFNQLRAVLLQLSTANYSMSIPLLSNATIGQHTRHIIELYIELLNGYTIGTVNYDARKRDYRIETDMGFAIEQLEVLLQQLKKENKTLSLCTEYPCTITNEHTIPTNYFREIVYNMEHTIHHLALINVALQIFPNIIIPQNFGVANATITYRNNLCAQ